MRNVYCYFVCFIFMFQPAFSQQDFCGTKDSDVDLLKVDGKSRKRRSLDMGENPTITLNLKIHVIANDNGSGKAIDSNSLDEIVSKFLDIYKPHGINFKIVGVVPLNDSRATFKGVKSSVDPNAINAFIFGKLGNLSGYASAKNQYFGLFYDKEVSMNRWPIFFAHEMGHCLGLNHTFSRKNDELVDGSNCAVTGDFVCDTPADSNGLKSKDKNGETYKPDKTNVMSYYWGKNRTLTYGQVQRMKKMIHLRPELTACITKETYTRPNVLNSILPYMRVPGPRGIKGIYDIKLNDEVIQKTDYYVKSRALGEVKPLLYNGNNKLELFSDDITLFSSVWVDFNGNLEFEDSELVFDASSMIGWFGKVYETGVRTYAGNNFHNYVYTGRSDYARKLQINLNIPRNVGAGFYGVRVKSLSFIDVNRDPLSSKKADRPIKYYGQVTDFSAKISCKPYFTRPLYYVGYYKMKVNGDNFYNRWNTPYKPWSVTDKSVSLSRSGNNLKVAGYYNPITSSVWIDKNKNDVFEEGELVVRNFKTNWSWSYKDISFDLPDRIPYGKYKMRIKGCFYCDSSRPCTGHVYGQSIDFTAKVSGSSYPFDSFDGGISSGINKVVLPDLDVRDEDTPVSIDKLNNLKTAVDVKVFPNPLRLSTGQKLSVSITKLSHGFQTGYRIFVFNLLGEKVLHKELSGDYVELDTSNLSPGTYILQLHDDSETLLKTERIILF